MEVKSDMLGAKISDIEAALPMHDSNSQQSQQQVFNAINILDKEKLSTTTIRGNKPDQSNWPPHCKRTLHQLWNPSFVELILINADIAFKVGGDFKLYNYYGNF